MSTVDFADVAAERATLAGIFRYGKDAFVDVDDLLEPSNFSVDINQIVYKCAQEFYKDGEDRKLDFPSLISTAKKLRLQHALDDPSEQRHLKALMNYPIELATVRPEAAKIYKLSIGKEADDIAAQIRRDLRKMTGDESLNSWMATLENPVMDFISKINNGDDDGIVQIAKGGMEWLDNILANPSDNIGIPSPFAKYNVCIGGGFRRKSISMVGARPKSGKMAPLDSPVYTPDGPVMMGDLAVGDLVSTPDGGAVRITSIHPQGMKDIYRVVFADGDSTECGLEHLWEVKHRRKHIYEVVTLEEIMKRGLTDGDHRKWQVRLPIHCFYRERIVPLDPYLLGLILGNGGITQNTITFTSADTDTVRRFNGLLPDGHRLELTNDPRGPYYYNLHSSGKRNKIKEALTSLGLLGKGSHDKFIPACYKFNSVEVRRAVLQGLCDTDGSASKNGYTLEYSTASKRLAYDVKELVQSLGGLATVNGRWTTWQSGKFWSYRVIIKHNDRKQFFRLDRKRDRMKLRTKKPLHRTILRVEYVGKKEAQCIKLDSAEGLYMTDHHIVTHNTVFIDNVCLHVSGELGIPTYNADTEMTQEEHLARILAHLTGIEIRKIESGKVDKKEAKLLRQKMEWLQGIPYYYESVIDKTFEEQIASMRRWVVKHVGYDSEGRTKDALIAYDYLQLTDPGGFHGDFKEYQLLGFQMVALHRLAKRCDVPILSMLQLNRDGIDKNTTAVASGSDRIIWKCSNFATLRRKDPEEIAEDGGPENGTLKLDVLIARHGEGTVNGNHINIKFTGKNAHMAEGPTRDELNAGKPSSQEKGFPVEVDENASFEQFSYDNDNTPI